jgi:hypothetical protein
MLPLISSWYRRHIAKRLLRVGLPAAVSAVVLLVVLAQAVLADPRDFTFENDSLSYITQLYVSPSSSTAWGDDILGVDVLPPGQSVDITFDTNIGRTCIYDILVVTEDGSRTRKNRENLCTTSTEYYSED